MALDPMAANATGAVLFLVTVDAGLNAYSAINSSPQTTELFGKERAETLMKYVCIADLTVIGLGLFSASIAHSWWPIFAAIVVVALMHKLYVHAMRKSLERVEY